MQGKTIAPIIMAMACHELGEEQLAERAAKRRNSNSLSDLRITCRKELLRNKKVYIKIRTWGKPVYSDSKLITVN
jgi:hypothetical protein